MNSILIVDDEYLARNKLRFLVDWEKYDFRIAHEATNAKEAIDILKKEHIDVIFTDVYMPGTDGIQLAEYVYNYHPDTSVVIMSNYGDFDYVKKAFSFNVVDYILKHTLSSESLTPLILTLKKRCQKRVDNSAFVSKVKEEEAYRNKIIASVTQGTKVEEIPENSLIVLMSINNIDLRMQAFSLEETGILYQNINNTIAQIIKDVAGFVIFENNNNLCLYLPFGDNTTEIEIMHDIGNYIQQINYSIYKFFNFNLLWGISCPSRKDYSIHECYKEAFKMLEKSPFTSKRSFNISIEAEDLTKLNSLSIKQEKDLLAALSELSKTKVNRILDEIFNNIEIKSPSDIILGELISIATKFCSEFNVSSKEITPLGNGPYEQSEYVAWSKDMFAYIIDKHLNESEQNYHFKYVQSVMEFISHNYSKNVTLKEISAYVGISEQYLSKIFKLQTGKTLSSYLTEYRVERAKEILTREEINLKFLYSMVGFNDYNYFFVVFKKHVGCTPNEYKKKYGNK